MDGAVGFDAASPISLSRVRRRVVNYAYLAVKRYLPIQAKKYAGCLCPPWNRLKRPYYNGPDNNLPIALGRLVGELFLLGGVRGLWPQF
jgi:hypothetical protein